MATARHAFADRSSRWLRTSVVLVVITALVPARRVVGGGEPDTRVGSIPREGAPAAGPAVPKQAPRAPTRVQELGADAARTPIEWHAVYVQPPGEALPPIAKTTLRVATAPGYERKAVQADLAADVERNQGLINNLDVGRHEILKHMYRRALVDANTWLRSNGRSPLPRILAVNSGGTGDFTRDQDITVFGGDIVREPILFDFLARAARDLGLEVVPKDGGGFDLPQIEVTLFPGRNDLPDARFATDVEQFALTYRRALAKQIADPEAYKGAGADIEVKGRRRPGEMYVQELVYEHGKPVRYECQTTQTPREARSLYRGTAPTRYRRWERASHIVSDYAQAWQHSRGGLHDRTKGPLKYGGRMLDQLSEFYGLSPWKDLCLDDKVAVVAHVLPQYDPTKETGRRELEKMVGSLDVACEVKATKKMPADVSEGADARALLFLRKAIVATTSEMAREMLDPPAFDPEFLKLYDLDAWNRMSAVERHRAARERDPVYRECVGRASMENLLMTMVMLRKVDHATGEGGGKATRCGERAIAAIVDGAPAHLAPLLRLGAEYADAWVSVEFPRPGADPAVRQAGVDRMMRLRADLASRIRVGGTSTPGLELLRAVEVLKPRDYVRASAEGRSLLPAAAAELRVRFDEHLRSAFPRVADEVRAMRQEIDAVGGKSYLKQRLAEEFFQWGTASDALQLVEMLQEGASAADCGKFVLTTALSNAHWSFGFLLGGVDVYDADPARAAEKARALGKNVTFATLSRLVPWAASAKVGFDVLQGTVQVTVGYAVNQAVAAKVDAAYVGEAGLRDPSNAGRVKGAARASGFSVLGDGHTVRHADPAGGPPQVGVDRAQVYRDYVRIWTGLEADDLPRTAPPRPEAAAFLKAHDDLVQVFLRQAEEFGPTWVSSRPGSNRGLHLQEPEVATAILAFQQELAAQCSSTVDEVLTNLAWSYQGYGDQKDRIHEGVVGRFAADVLGGMIADWEHRLVERALAVREIERAASQADLAALAALLGDLNDPKSGAATRAAVRRDGDPPPPPPPAYALAVRVEGARAAEPPGESGRGAAPATGATSEDAVALDGAQAVRVSAVLEGHGEVSDEERPVKIEVMTSRWRVVEKAVRPPDGAPADPARAARDALGGAASALAEPGDLVEDRIVVRALADDGAGPELARHEVTVRVRLPQEEAADDGGIPLFRHRDFRDDGTLAAEWVYFERFEGIPASWGDNGGICYHGDHVYYHPDGKTPREVVRYRFGLKDGLEEHFTADGFRYIVEGYKADKPDGPYEHRRQDTRAVWHRGQYVEGQRDGVWELIDPPKHRSRYEMHTYRRGVLEGPSEVRRHDGSSERGEYRADKKSGVWVEVNVKGVTMTGPYVDGDAEGWWTATDSEGRTQRVRFEHGRWVEETEVKEPK